MALPGLNLSAATEIAAPVVHEIQKDSEWRFEVAFGSNVEVKLLSGTAEIFGTELAPNQTYTFSGAKAAIYTWHGCRIQVSGTCQVEYTAEETPMVSYANVHFALEKLRRQAAIDGREGPRVMVVGPDNAGKTSLIRTLTGYAAKTGGQPLVVNMDSREGMLGIPGSLTAAAFGTLMDVEEGWGSSPTSGPSPMPVKMPVVYFFGLPSPESNSAMYKSVTTRMALAVTERFSRDVASKETGCFIDTPGILSQGKNNYDILHHIATEFSVNVLLVLGSERLHSDMLRRFDGHRASTDEPISVIKLLKSGGVVDRDEAYMRHMRQTQIREYFFGDNKSTLSPHTQQVDFSQVTIYKIVEPSTILTSLLPGGDEDNDTEPSRGGFHGPPIFEKVEPSLSMQYSILAVTHVAPNSPHEDIRDSSLMGFVYVAEVDEQRKKLRILAPVSGRIPNKALVWGTWPEGFADLVG
ncbi:Clp1-domain-containing protein [Xylona heveae TC161]|uniref:Polynucleotide 5'-hydroxyl-kinase GRC3 n=1 Tax=Xylona heveae (strain CBS 132557 / TC161) TaxID=1328760 RepID=A0A165H9Y3_XYLHT|nr:Clp1-domain-containing protein [Xylona heveae TC161]KZF23192.1 Clp1-domain-containing protein [Xylona heveae TC161]